MSLPNPNYEVDPRIMDYQTRDGKWRTGCRGLAYSARGPAGTDGKWTCPICGKRVGAIKNGYLKVHQPLRNDVNGTVLPFTTEEDA